MNGSGGQDNRNVQVTLNADVANYQRQMDAANKSTMSLTGAITNLGKALDEIVRKTSKGLVLFGTGGMAGLVAAAYQANKLNDAFSQVRSTAALTGQSTAALERSAEGLAQKIPMSTEALGQLMATVQDLGISGTDQITKFTEVAARLGEATNTPPGELFTGLVQLTRTLGNSVNDLDRYSSALVDLSKRNGVAASSILDFANAFQSVAGAAGMTEQQIMGIATAVAKTGTDSYSAANTLIRVTGDLSSALATNSGELSTYATILGTTREQLKAMAAKDAGGVIVDLFEALHAKGKDAIPYIQQLGLDGPRALKTIDALTSSQANLKGAVTEANNAFNTNTALNKSSDAGWKGLSSALEKLHNDFNQVMVTLGGPFLTVMTVLATAADKVFQIFNKIPGPIKEMAALAVSLTPIVMVIAGIELAARRLLAIMSPFAMIGRIAPFIGGMRAGITGNEPRPIDPEFRMLNLLQGAGVRTGQRVARWMPEKTEGESLLHRAAMFPISMFNAGVHEGWQFLRHPFAPDLRNQRLANNPYTAHGWMGQRFQDLRDIAAGEKEPPSRFGGFIQNLATGMYGTPDEIKAREEAHQQRVKEYNARPGAGVKESVEGGAHLGNNLGKLANSIVPLASNLLGVAGVAASVGTAGYALYQVFQHLHAAARDAAKNMDDLGAASASAMGKQYNRPNSSFGYTPAIKAFSSQDIAKAEVGSFTDKIGKDVDQLRKFKHSSTTRGLAAQEMVNNLIANANGGAPLTQEQQDTVRRTLINAYGADAAQSLYPSLNFSGTSATSQAAAGGQLAALTPDTAGAGKDTRARLRVASTFALNQLQSGNATTGALAFGQYLQGAGSGGHYGNFDRFKAALETFQDQYNKGKDKSEQINLTKDLPAGMPVNQALGYLSKHGNTATKSFLDGLSEAGLNLQDLNSSLPKLSKAVSDQAKQARAVTDSQTGVLGAMAQALGFNIGQSQDVNYGYNVFRAQTMVGNQAGGGLMGLMSPKALQAQYGASIGTLAGLDPNDPAYQFYVQQAQQQQQGMLGAMGMWNGPGQTTSQFLNIIQGQVGTAGGGLNASNPNVRPLIQNEIGTTQSMLNQDISGLKSYLTQVHDMEIERQHMEEDHTIQLTRMERDRNIQVAESQYQYQISTKRRWHDFYESIRQMTYQYADAFNPFQRQQSQYTIGASLAVDNVQRENQYMSQVRGNLSKLQKMGVSADVIRTLGLDDPQNFQQLQRFVEDLAQNPKLVDAWNKSIKNRLDLSKAFATDPMNSKFADMKRQFDYQSKNAEEDFNHAMKVSADAYNRSLGDFQQSYELANKRLSESEARLGENLFGSIDKLMKAAKDSGIKNLQEYAQEIFKNLTGLNTAIANFAAAGVPMGGQVGTGSNTDVAKPGARVPRAAEGGIVMPKPGGTMVLTAEAGYPEAIIPLKSGLAGMRTAGMGSVIYNGNVSNHYDASSHITGPITVTGVTNPKNLASQIQKQARVTALRRPASTRAAV